jgi:hypothetical protein
MTMPKRRRRFLVGGILLLALGAGFYLYEEPAAGAYLCPGCYGFKENADRLYLDGAMGKEEIAAVEAVHAEALQRVRDFWGTFDREPMILVCGSEACDARMGYRGAKARAYGGTFILVFSKGRTAAFFAHEFSHVELFSRLGTWRSVTNAVPAWFNEGVAVLVSRDRRYVVTNDDGALGCKTAPDGPLPATFRAWGRAAGDKSRPLYAMAACAVLDWMAQNGGREGVLDAVGDAADGEPFPPI